jgi:hypothetical protein
VWIFVLDGEKNVKKESRANTFSAIFLGILYSYSFTVANMNSAHVLFPPGMIYFHIQFILTNYLHMQEAWVCLKPQPIKR